jgi:hypothetical protein
VNAVIEAPTARSLAPLEQEAIASPLKPISFSISTDDIQALYACRTNPDQYNQLLLAKLKDCGGPVEGVLHLRLSHGKLAKLKDNPLEAQNEFVYCWLPDEYVAAIAQGAGGRA